MTVPVDPPGASAHQSFVTAWSRSLGRAVDNGVILEADAPALLATVEQSSVLVSWKPTA